MEMKIHGAHKHAHPGIAKDPKKGNGHSPGTCASVHHRPSLFQPDRIQGPCKLIDKDRKLKQVSPPWDSALSSGMHYF